MIRPDVYQIYYDDSQRPLLDPAFIPYDNRENKRPDWCEYHIFREQYAKGVPQSHDLSGYVSWKFAQKTGINGKQFLDFILANPGNDLYFVNPFQGEHTQRLNVWVDGEHWHRGIAAFAQNLFDKVYAPFELQVDHMINPAKEFAYCNYWVATPEFWGRYIAFCEPAYDYIENHATPAERDFLDKPAVEGQSICYRPYIMERLLPTMLYLARTGRLPAISYAAYDLGHPLQLTSLAIARDSLKKLGVHDEPMAVRGLMALDGYEDEFRALDAQKTEDYLHYRKEQDTLEAEYHGMTGERDALAIRVADLERERAGSLVRRALTAQEWLARHPKLLALLGR